MRISEARSRADAAGALNIFIAMTDEEGDGEVVAVKDLVDVRGTSTTAGGRILPTTPALEDAPLVRNIREHGCIVIGKTNLHEWAFGSTSMNQHYGTVHNPRDPARVAGGSSGGSAAAVAAGMCDWAVGSDTGGSIRIPAGLCGVVGFKPTFGTIDTTGVVPLSFSLDTIGSIAPTVDAATRAVAMMARREGWAPVRAIAFDRLRLAVPANWVQDLDAETEAAWRKVSGGIQEIEFPARDRMQKVCLDIMYSEAAAFHRGWLATQPDRYSPDILARLTAALDVSGAEYVDALADQQRLRAEVERCMRGIDALLVPATAAVAPLIAEQVNTEPLVRFTRPFNVTGQPVFVLPAPTSGLPVGIQVVGHVGHDAELAAFAGGIEDAWTAAGA